MLHLRKITHIYKQGDETNKVIDNLNLTLHENSIVGLIGPSGSGKTTLLNLIGLIEHPSLGDLRIDNLNINELKDEAKTKFRKEKISFIFQNNQLLEDFTCLENIALPLYFLSNNLKRSKNKAKEILKEFKLFDRRNLKPALLSGGEQQRISVLRALIKEPKILLADEPTGSLDKTNSKIVMKNIINISRKLKTLTIIATHNLKFLPMFDITYEIVNGKLIKV